MYTHPHLTQSPNLYPFTSPPRFLARSNARAGHSFLREPPASLETKELFLLPRLGSYHSLQWCQMPSEKVLVMRVDTAKMISPHSVMKLPVIQDISRRPKKE